jgi:hypothetical protein
MTAPNGGIAGALAGTRPWVRLVSILGFLGAGFMFLVGVMIALGGSFFPADAAVGGSGFAVLGVIYACMGLLYFIPSRHLWRYGSFIDAYLRDPQQAQLEQALEAQRRFWKFVGILAAISLLFFFVGMGLAIILPAMLRAGGSPV